MSMPGCEGVCEAEPSGLGCAQASLRILLQQEFEAAFLAEALEQDRQSESTTNTNSAEHTGIQHEQNDPSDTQVAACEAALKVVGQAAIPEDANLYEPAERDVRARPGIRQLDCMACGGLAWVLNRLSVRASNCPASGGCELAWASQHPELYNPADPRAVAATPGTIICADGGCVATISTLNSDGTPRRAPVVIKGACKVDGNGIDWRQKAITAWESESKVFPERSFGSYDGEPLSPQELAAAEALAQFERERLAGDV